MVKGAATAVEDFHDKDWVTAQVYYTKDGGRTQTSRTEIVNVVTDQRYLHEQTSDTAMKAGLLATMGIPFYTLANIACQVIRAVTLVFNLAIRSIVDLFTSLSCSTIGNLFVNLTYEIPAVLIQTVWAIVKAPICAIGMEFCAICSCFSPITWRVHLGDIERFWRGSDRKYNFLETKAEFDRVSDFFTNRNSPYVFYIAYCFQPWGSLKDSNVMKNLDGTPRYTILKPNV